MRVVTLAGQNLNISQCLVLWSFIQRLFRLQYSQRFTRIPVQIAGDFSLYKLPFLQYFASLIPNTLVFPIFDVSFTQLDTSVG